MGRKRYEQTERLYHWSILLLGMVLEREEEGFIKQEKVGF